MIDEIVVCGIPGSPFLRAVQMGLEEKRATYRVEAMGPGESKTEAHLKRHPFGRVPAFRHGDFGLYETQAILRYLDDVFAEPPFESTDPRTAARMNQIIGINDWYFFPKAAAPIVFNRVIGPALLGAATDEAVIAAAMPMARICVAELERLIGAQPFLAGEGLSIADLMLAPQLYLFVQTPEGESLLKGTRLKAWLDRMTARPSMRATEPPPALRRAA
jgi:glutathione S-transferase